MAVSPQQKCRDYDDYHLTGGETEQPSSTSSSGRRRYWQQLGKRWKRKGVVEIDSDHMHFETLMCVKQGLQELINLPELGPKDELNSSDYVHIWKKDFISPNGQKFEFCSYASNVFATLRQATGLKEDDFLESVAPTSLPYLEFISNSKGGQNFFLTNDKVYFMKTEKKYYVNFFLNILRLYLQHFLQYPHSLIVKYIGLYSIKLEGRDKLHFYVMQSIFYPNERIEMHYDLKGCLTGRYQKVRKPDSPILTVYKDQNFNEEKIDLGANRDWFLQQLRIDVNLMENLGVQDYSLLVGIHPLNPEDKKQDLGDLVTRVQKSIPVANISPKRNARAFSAGVGTGNMAVTTPDNVSQPDHTACNTLPGHADLNQSPLGDHTTDGTVPRTQKAWSSTVKSLNNSVAPSSEGYTNHSMQHSPSTERVYHSHTHSPGDTSPPIEKSPSNHTSPEHPPVRRKPFSFIDPDILEEMGAKNRRLLPMSKNPLHMIDGPTHRYYVGIIDFFTMYEFRQKCGRVLKSIKYCCGDHSTLPPEEYARRFLHFINEHVE